MFARPHEVNHTSNKAAVFSQESPQASRLTLQNLEAPPHKARAFSQKKITITSANNHSSQVKYAVTAPSFDLRRFSKPVNQPNPISQWKKSVYADKDRDRKISLRDTSQVYNSNCTINVDINNGFSRNNAESKLDYFPNMLEGQKQQEELRREIMKSIADHLSKLNIEISSQATIIGELRSRIAVIEEELKNKNIELASVRSEISQLSRKSGRAERGGNNDFLAKKIEDLEKVLRLASSQGKKDQQQISRKIGQIDAFVVKYFHQRLSQIHSKVEVFLSLGNSKLEALKDSENVKINSITNLQLRINCLHQSLTQAETSFQQSPNSSNCMSKGEVLWEELSDFFPNHSRQKFNNSLLENQSNMSFADDYFFHPEPPLPRFNQQEPKQTTPNFRKLQQTIPQRLETLIHILQIHEKPLPCIIDTQRRIISMLTNECIVDESGREFRLSSDEIKMIEDGNLLKIHKRFDQSADSSLNQQQTTVVAKDEDRDYWESFDDY